MPPTTASWQHCRKAKDGDSHVGKELWRQDKSLKDLSRTLSPCFTTWHDLFWGMHGCSDISTVTSCLVHEEKLFPSYLSHKLKYIGQYNFAVTFIQWKNDGWLWKGGCDGLDSEVYLFIDSHQLEEAVGSNHLFICSWKCWCDAVIHTCTPSSFPPTPPLRSPLLPFVACASGGWWQWTPW